MTDKNTAQLPESGSAREDDAAENFGVPASVSLQERRPRTLKHGDTFGLFDPNGDIVSGPGSPEGLFHRDTRYLSQLFLTLGGVRPLLLSSSVRDDNTALTCDLANPDLQGDEAGHLLLAHDQIQIRRSRFLWNATCWERILLRNYSGATRWIEFEIALAADFADLFEVRGTVRQRRGILHPTVVTEDGLQFVYDGLDDRRRTTVVQFEPKPARLSSNRAEFRFRLQQGEASRVYLTAACNSHTPTVELKRSFFVAFRSARQRLRDTSARAASVVTSNEIFNETIRRSISDLYMLVTQTPEGPYPYAGIPWFSTVFGRDGIIAALQTLWIDPRLARGVLAHLAANQAREVDPQADAEPGKILHEVRHGEMAELGEVPFRRYYGSVDSTPLFVMLAGAYLARTDDLPTIEQLWPNIERALEWIQKFGDRDGDGFVEYGRRAENGLSNQGWKDSQDSIFHKDGSLATGPIALCEVQAYTWAAFRAAADICARLGMAQRSAQFARDADMLAQRFDEAFWDGDLNFYVLALDGTKKPCRVRSSNAGHALTCGIASPDRAAMLVNALMGNRSFSGWGIRTISDGEARFNPMSYHNGSVWPHDNALIAAGFARYGFTKEAARIFEGLFSAASRIDLRRLPELFCGFARQQGQGPTFYPVACSPQAWAATSLLSLLQSCLGLTFRPQEREIRFDRPQLPDFLDEVILRRLVLPSGQVDVAITRSAGEVTVTTLKRTGDVRIAVLP